MQIYVGVDISKTYFDAFSQGKSARFNNDSKGHQKFIQTLPKDAWIVMESTGTYGYRLAETLAKNGFLVSMLNPLQVKRFAQSRAKRAKTDALDAKLLVEYAQSLENCDDERDALRLWIPPTENQLYLKQLRTTCDSLIKMQTMLSNQIEALDGYSAVADVAKNTLTSLLKIFAKKIALLEDAMNSIINQDFNDQAKSIESIPGVARKTCTAILASIGDIARFDSAKAFAAFCGLSPTVIQSDTSVHGRGCLNNLGVLALSAKLFMCALSAMRWNKPCKELYERLLAKGKSKKLVELHL